jgi:hypothetical protein
MLLSQLPVALNQRVSLSLTSSRPLCRDIAGSPSYQKAVAQGAPRAKRPRPIPQHTAGPTIQMRPVELLLRLGLAMLPPRHLQQNLAPWHWSIVRHGYLIDSPPTPGDPLALNTLIDDYRYHNMTGLSEAIGVGCAVTYASRWLRGQVPAATTIHLPVDVEYLLGTTPIAPPGRAAQIRARPKRHASRRPDYVIVAESNLRVTLMVVECKGASTDVEKSIDQLGSAMHQLAAIRFQPPRGQPRPQVFRHAYAARLARHGGPVELYGADPDERGEPWIELTEDRSESDIATLAGNGHLVVHDAPALARELLRCVHERAAAWAGIDMGAEPDGADELERRESRFGDLIGSTSVFRLPNRRRVTIFTGALAETLGPGRDEQDAGEKRPSVTQRLGEIDESLFEAGVAPLDAADEPERAATVISDDGVALEIRVD